MKFIERKRNIFYCRNYKVSNNNEQPAYTFWCPECKKMIEKESEMHHVLPEYKDRFKNSSSDFIANEAHRSPEMFEKGLNGKAKVTCPHCGYDMSAIYDYYGNDKEKPFFLTRCRCWTEENSELVSYNIFVRDDDITVSGFFLSYFPLPENGILKPCKINTRIVFNIKTGMTYSFRSVDFHTKKPIMDVFENRIINATYTDGCAHTLAKKTLENLEVFNDVATALAEAHGVSLTSDDITEMFRSTKISMLSLSLFNRFPLYNNAFRKYMSYEIIGQKYDRNGFRRNTRKFLKFKNMQEDPSLFVKYIKNNKVPEIKALKKRLIKNPYLIKSFDILTNLGFKDINVILGILDDNENIVIELSHFINNPCNYYYTNQWNNIVELFKFLIKMKGETVVRKNIFKDMTASIRTIEDTARMFHCFKEAGILKKSYFKGNITDIHDRLSLDYKKLQTKKEDIEYSEFETALNDNIDGYEFHLAIDTHQLIDIGTRMGICVGSYGHNAVCKNCVIVAMTKENKYVGCIELRFDTNSKTQEDFFRLVQAKAKFNNLLQENKAIALRKWIQKHKINAEECRDYIHIKNDQICFDTNKIYQGMYNYANFGIHDNEEDFIINVEAARNDVVEANFMELPDDFDETDPF